jgi:hypothetical protein
MMTPAGVRLHGAVEYTGIEYAALPVKFILFTLLADYIDPTGLPSSTCGAD